MNAELARRLAQVNAEIRGYPGPIARCDQHLQALIEEREKLMKALHAA